MWLFLKLLTNFLRTLGTTFTKIKFSQTKFRINFSSLCLIIFSLFVLSQLDVLILFIFDFLLLYIPNFQRIRTSELLLFLH